MKNKKASIRIIQNEVPDCAVRGLVIGRTTGGGTLEILRIEARHVNRKSYVHKISEIGLMK